MRKKLRIGIMGGTFDPIHYGHLVTAEEALVQFNLDKVVFMPTGNPVRKTHRKVTPAEHRYLMTVIATASNPDFEVSRMEVDRPGPTYTVDTMLALRQELGPDADLYFITGADAVWEILTWKDSEALAGVCSFIAATRPGYDLSRFSRDDAERMRVEFMEVPALAISSTDIRRRVAERRPIRYLLPEAVAAYVRKNGLYASEA
ncbi:nicotinate-nucleotide adenylyltransferase [Coriobacteriia bacterium Es71-Z0120]|uniref:nicotinate-nucleotide adenylyltransferase n=1 Tax=Parvivirga hydrogeniphila TaxID=2939460 RepID=UPI002260F5D6|nr:nicotinate-nucleotide adenylyltransferase [Parvivirga hydrogeniphila]MCL4078976.1 nicotinate-nucleotide adenylyltransferase [Parvivirga hydrogeniphila]